MNLLTKRDKDNPSGFISLEELSSLITNNDLEDKLDNAIKELDSLNNGFKKLPKLDKTNIMNKLMTSKVINFNGVNISSVGSIEKDSSIKIGTIYYNKTLDLIRLKKKSGWVNL